MGAAVEQIIERSTVVKIGRGRLALRAGLVDTKLCADAGLIGRGRPFRCPEKTPPKDLG